MLQKMRAVKENYTKSHKVKVMVAPEGRVKQCGHVSMGSALDPVTKWCPRLLLLPELETIDEVAWRDATGAWRYPVPPPATAPIPPVGM